VLKDRLLRWSLLVYDTSGAASDRNSVVLNDIHIDIMDYIVPATCTDGEFRQMWAEFEWENKVAVNTNIVDLHEYLDHIIQCTNMKCLTPEKVGLSICWSILTDVIHRACSDVKRSQNHEAEAEAKAKASRPELRARGQDYEAEAEAKNNYEKSIK